MKRARIEVCDALQTQSQRRMESLQSGWTMLSESLRDELGFLQDKMGEDDAMTTIQIDEIMAQLAQIKGKLQELLVKGSRLDKPTGSTPAKKAWQYPANWSTTGSRENILCTRQQGSDTETLEMPIQSPLGSPEADKIPVQQDINERLGMSEDELLANDELPADTRKPIPQRLDPLKEQPINLPRTRSRRRR